MIRKVQRRAAGGGRPSCRRRRPLPCPRFVLIKNGFGPVFKIAELPAFRRPVESGKGGPTEENKTGREKKVDNRVHGAGVAAGRGSGSATGASGDATGAGALNGGGVGWAAAKPPGFTTDRAVCWDRSDKRAWGSLCPDNLATAMAMARSVGIAPCLWLGRPSRKRWSDPCFPPAPWPECHSVPWRGSLPRRTKRLAGTQHPENEPREEREKQKGTGEHRPDALFARGSAVRGGVHQLRSFSELPSRGSLTGQRGASPRRFMKMAASVAPIASRQTRSSQWNEAPALW